MTAGDARSASFNDTLTLLLPPRERLRAGSSLPPQLALLRARADLLAEGAAGRDAQLLRVFDVLPRRIAIAPLTRQLDAGDGDYGVWLRADPAHVRADMATARMLACGELGLNMEETRQLVAALQPLFGDEGCPISAPVPSRWYLMISAQTRLPPFAPPAQALGDDLHAHMPAGDEGRRWRRLLNEAQVILHNHPVNAARARVGKVAVNSLWFWGAGAMPDHVRAEGLRIASDDPLVTGLAARAGAPLSEPQPETLSAADGPNVVDLGGLRDVAEIETPWLAAALAALARRRLSGLILDFADGGRLHWQAGHRWRFWRRPASAL